VPSLGRVRAADGRIADDSEREEEHLWESSPAHRRPRHTTWKAGGVATGWISDCRPRLRPSPALASEYAAANILVNAVCLGRLKSAQWTRRWQASCAHVTLDEFHAEQGASIPLQRLGEAEDVADLVCFLASARTRYITGTAINIDGGLSGTV